jgi:hypothetical protein
MRRGFALWIAAEPAGSVIHALIIDIVPHLSVMAAQTAIHVARYSSSFEGSHPIEWLTTELTAATPNQPEARVDGRRRGHDGRNGGAPDASSFIDRFEGCVPGT